MLLNFFKTRNYIILILNNKQVCFKSGAHSYTFGSEFFLYNYLKNVKNSFFNTVNSKYNYSQLKCISN